MVVLFCLSISRSLMSARIVFSAYIQIVEGRIVLSVDIQIVDGRIVLSVYIPDS